jgi:hypothetical protein
VTSEPVGGGVYLRDVGQVLDDEMKGLVSIAHAAQHEDLLLDESPALAQFMGSLQPVALAADEEPHEALWLIDRIQLHLRAVREAPPGFKIRSFSNCQSLISFEIRQSFDVFDQRYEKN